MSSVIYYLGQELTRERQHTAEQYQQAVAAKIHQTEIPRAAALAICQQIQAENQGSWWARHRCAACVAHGEGGIPARLIGSRIGCCDCPAVNRRYHAQQVDKK